jgi:hypothetical protein
VRPGASSNVSEALICYGGDVNAIMEQVTTLEAVGR